MRLLYDMRLLSVACGGGHTLVVAEDGRQLFACGMGTHGQLGCGTREHQLLPAQLPALPALLHDGERLVMVAAGRRHSAACTSAGEVLTFGEGKFGQLGQGDWNDLRTPARLDRERFGGSPVLMVACGGIHMLVVTEAGRLFAFGDADNGQLGLGDRKDRGAPVEVGGPHFGGAPIVYAVAGFSHSGAMTSGGAVFTWGWGAGGRLGHGDEERQLVPKELAGQFGGCKVAMLAAGWAHTVVLTADGALWACGHGGSGQLGVGDTADRHAPVRVEAEAFGKHKVRMVACGHIHTVAVTEEGGLWAWGKGERGRLGHNDMLDRQVPERVGVDWFGGARIVTAACGGAHTAAVTEDGALYTWGAASDPGSQEPRGLGHEDLADKPSPTLVAPRLLLGARVGRCIALGRLHAVALAMGTHGRLGAGSAIMPLAGEPGLLQLLVEACGGRPEGGAGD